MNVLNRLMEYQEENFQASYQGDKHLGKLKTRTIIKETEH